MTKHLICLIGALLFLAAAPVVGFAEDVPAKSEPALPPYAEQINALKNCKFITHNCELCYVAKNGNVACSSAGIACEPTHWSCLLTSTAK